MLLFSKLSFRPTRKVGWLEWVVFVLGFIVVAGVIGLLVYEAVRFEGSSPTLTVALGTPGFQHGSYTIPVTIENTGGKTASNVEVEVTVHFSSGEEEQASVTFQFVPRHSSETGWVTFGRHPAQADSVAARVLGYGSP